MISLLRKAMRSLCQQGFNKMATYNKVLFIKRIFTSHQKKFIKKLLFPESEFKSSQINLITTRLYNLGFTERPLEELHALVKESSRPEFKRATAWELARWHANQKNKEGYCCCLKFLSIAKSGERDSKGICYNAIMEAECYEKLGNLESGEQVIRHAINQLGPETNLYLAAANFESSLAGKIRWINKALRLCKLSPILYNAEASKILIECLQPVLSKKKEKHIIDNPMPLVSVILAAYNAQSTIGYALDSIMAQTWPNLEILVIDDCSSDDTALVIESYMEKDSRIKIITAEENQGLFVSRNMALNIAEGEFVTTHDADDWSHPEKIKRQVKHLINNPSLVGNTSQMARTDQELKFYQDSKRGSIVSLFRCSFMFRRKPVTEAIGYWDHVRFSADSEFIRRVIKVFGTDSVVHLSTGPLSFYRRTTNSLTGNQAFGHPGYYMGVRKEYYEAQTYYHHKAKSLYYHFPQKKRPFSVPEPMWIEREKVGSSGCRYFNVIMVSDFRMDDSVANIVDEIKQRIKKGMRIGLIQMYSYNFDPKRKIMCQVREVIDSETVQMLVYGEKVWCDSLILYNPEILQEKQRYLPNVETRDLKVIINQPPMSHYGPDGVVRYEIKKCQRHLEEYFGKQATWYPINLSIRKILYRYHAEDIHAINLSRDDWANKIHGKSR